MIKILITILLLISPILVFADDVVVEKIDDNTVKVKIIVTTEKIMSINEARIRLDNAQRNVDSNAQECSFKTKQLQDELNAAAALLIKIEDTANAPSIPSPTPIP